LGTIKSFCCWHLADSFSGLAPRPLFGWVASLEGSVPIIKDYPVYDFKVEARVHFFTENVRYWHKTDVSLLSVKRPLIGAKRT